MKLQDASTSPVLYSLASANPSSALKPLASARPFGEVLAQARQAAPSRTVVSGDTLMAVVKDEASRRGVNLSDGEALRQAQQLARDSGISNPGRIFPGQRLDLAGLHARLEGMQSPAATSQVAAMPAAQVLARTAAQERSAPVNQGAGSAWPAASRQAMAAYGTSPTQASSRAQPAAVRPGASSGAVESASPGKHFLAGPHPVLEQTLDRAVARGFIPAIERGDVYDKILQLAARHKFRPDDFARMTLLESDGMNPRATNERCHGIIQFCDGNDRGAATAGYAANPRAILGFSVYQQLHLVDKYFSEVGVKSPGAPPGPASLDDLYLSVLSPAARSSLEPNAPLNVPGTQASYLHVGRDRSAPITRQSILEGLQQNAAERLASFSQRMRPQAMRDDILPVSLGGTRLR